MRPVALALAALLLAGCVAREAAPEDASVALAAEEAPAPLDLAATGCREGGGHSVHPKRWAELPEPWTPADILEDVGPQVVWSEYVNPLDPPREGETFGNYHATVLCETWTFRGRALEGALFGFVGERVERPPFDTAPGPEPDRHYLVTVIAATDEELLAELTAFGITAMAATAAWTEAGAGVERILMRTERNGDYDTLVRWKPWGDAPPAHVRLWFQSTGEDLPHGHEGRVLDREATPVALDLWTVGGTHVVGDAQGYFSHSGTGHHAPLPGAYGHAAALGYRDFDRAWTWGPRYPDVVLTQVWDH